MSQSRFSSRRVRVLTQPKMTIRSHTTRTLSELVLVSPDSSPRDYHPTNRLDMDIEVNSFYEHPSPNVRNHHENRISMDQSIDEETAPSSRSSDIYTTNNSTLHNTNNNQEHEQDIAEPESEPMEIDLNNNNSNNNITSDSPSVSQVVDMLFEMHSALKSRQYGQRTAASALAASNLVNSSFINMDPVTKDEQLEAIEETKKMLECSICQEVFTNATEATCCGQIFCKDCIERWVHERHTCPMCRESITYSLLNTARHAQRMANELKVACTYCSLVCKKAELENHVTTCDLAPQEPPPPQDVCLRNQLITHASLNILNLTKFLLMPSPPLAHTMQCYIRTRGGGQYELYTQDSHILLCSAVRRRQYDMSVSFSIYATNPNASTNSVQVAKLEKNYMGSQYTIFDTSMDQSMSEIGAVQYAATFGKSPRQMRVAVPHVRTIENQETEFQIIPWNSQHKEDTMLSQVENPDPNRAIHLINKPPVWIEALQAYCLDFGGRVAAASVKNFLLSHPDDMNKTLMLFGRTQDRQIYSMDYAHPLSPVQAFAIALSSMDSHLVTFD